MKKLKEICKGFLEGKLNVIEFRAEICFWAAEGPPPPESQLYLFAKAISEFEDRGIE